MFFIAGFFFSFFNLESIHVSCIAFNYFVPLIKQLNFNPVIIRKRTHATQHFSEEKMSQTLIHVGWDYQHVITVF